MKQIEIVVELSICSHKFIIAIYYENMENQVVIIAGGKGTRLKKESGNLPKSLVKIGRKTILDYQIENIIKNNITNIHFCLGYGHDEILNHLAVNYKNLKYTYTIENEPLGTYGALYNSKDKLKDNIFLLLGDVLTNYKIKEGFNDFLKFNYDIMLVSRYTDHPHDSDLLISNNQNKVIGIERESDLDQLYSPIGNTGLLYIKKTKIKRLKKKQPDVVKDYIKNNLRSLNVFHSLTVDYIKDVGTPDRLSEAKKNIKNIFYEKPIICFLDRDETLIFDQGNENNYNNIKFKPYAINFLKFLQKKGIKVILVTNQPGVAKGYFNTDDVNNFHNYLQLLLIKKKIKPLNAIYFCPHHPQSGFEKENKAYKIKCDCRKPNIGMVSKAIGDLHLENSKYFFVGDTKNDYLLSKKINSKIYIVKSKFTEIEYFHKKDVEVNKNLNEVVKLINNID